MTTVGEGKQPVNLRVNGGINLLLIAGIIGAILAAGGVEAGEQR